jgi:hypothetical protein
MRPVVDQQGTGNFSPERHAHTLIGFLTRKAFHALNTNAS